MIFLEKNVDIEAIAYIGWWPLPCHLLCQGESRIGYSYMYLITHMRRKGIYHGAIYLIDWNSLHPISIDKSKFCRLDDPIVFIKSQMN